ncbi:MAG: carbon-nitrogen hydrolase family protein [Pseudomonadales bacterium]|nr:carbon-nitrogen hydrolase family protein [Pseudomonadales bacterium]
MAPNTKKDSPVPVKIAAVQMLSSLSFDTNLKAADKLIRDAAEENVRAIFLPENFLIFANDNPRDFAESQSGQAISFVSDLAAELDCWIFAGTIPLATNLKGKSIGDNRVRAASLVFDQNGIQVARYDKIHMFDVDVADNQKQYRESNTFESGRNIVDVKTPFGNFGLSVCYDIRFPEVYRRLRDSEVRSFVIPSAFTRLTGKAHFEVLMRARAIEHFCFTIAACQGGRHDSGRETYGNSMIVSPWGEILSRAGEGEAVIFAALDYSEQDEVRKRMPVHLQRKSFLR